MPAPASLTSQTLILRNGLHVELCHAPRLKRCAAALRVAAGSHDVAPDWPGLAHFLEHLFFLGTERFPAEDNLMAFVQRHGGQVNASTRERTTDFFFELPPPVFAGGLERLCDMLAHPRMAFDEQLREREILHAEFIAWSRDEAARNQMTLLEPISMNHPLRWFHAGNRYSLVVPRPDFQQALRDFYQQFYQAGQMTLSLAGPQSLADLRSLAERFGGLFTMGAKVAQVAPPRLMKESSNTHISIDSRRMHLLFACEDLPDRAAEAVGFLGFWLGNSQAGGLIAELKAQGLAESLDVVVLHQFGGQVLLDVEVVLPAMRPAHNQITAQIFSWLSFFKTHYRALRNEYDLLQQKRLDVAGALTLARHFSDSHASSGLSDRGASTLDVLLDRLRMDAASLSPAATEHQPESTWRLPQPNAFLRSVQPAITICPPLPSVTFSEALPDTNGQGAVYLRWTLKSALPALWQMLNNNLKSLIDEAQQAGVNVAFSAFGNYWQLKAVGLTDPMSAVLQAALEQLSHPDAATLARYGQPSTEVRLIPIRQLLKALPDRLLKTTTQEAHEPLSAAWQNATWSGLALGFPIEHRSTLCQVLNATPGTPDSLAPQAPAVTKEKRWETELSESSEDAVLIFCAAPGCSAAHEACWRLIAHIAQTPFYQRLRVELQLGYAVFSGFRQIAGQSGLLFGVQSPSATAAELARHIEQFIAGMPGLIVSADIAMQRQTLASQLDLDAMETEQAAEILWQAHLAGRREPSLNEVKHYLSNLHVTDLLAAVADLAGPTNTWLYLSNRSRPCDS